MRKKLGPKIAVYATLALMSLPGLARGKDLFRGDAPAPPPEPNALDIEVPRGGPVWITLSAYSLTSEIIRYRIRRQPTAGQLAGAPQIVSEATAVVKYRPPPGTGPGEDSFSYQVQSVAGVSVPAEVHIRITDKDPVLVAPTDLDFGEVLPDQSARRSLELQNIGGGRAQGTVRTPDGWTVEGDAAYSVGAGEKQNFTLVFTPREERGYTGDVEYTGDLGRATDLTGKEVAPIAVPAGTLELIGTGIVRIGTIHVENRTDKALTLRVMPGPDLQADASIQAPAKGAAEIMVQTTVGEDRADIHSLVTIEGACEKLEVPVHAAPLRETVGSLAAPSSAGSPAQTPPPATVASGLGAEVALPDASLPQLAADIEEPPAPESGVWVAPVDIEIMGKDGARLTSNFKGAEPARTWRVEVQTVALDAQGTAQAKWSPFAGAMVKADGQSVSAELAHLAPNALYVVRLIGVDEQGRVVALSAAGQVWTARTGSGGHWGWVALGLAVLAGAGAWVWKRRQEA